LFWGENWPRLGEIKKFGLNFISKLLNKSLGISFSQDFSGASFDKKTLTYKKTRIEFIVRPEIKMQEKIPDRQQEALFNKILGKLENTSCADCRAKGPCWAS
jgi:hypothetical protein